MEQVSGPVVQINGRSLFSRFHVTLRVISP